MLFRSRCSEYAEEKNMGKFPPMGSAAVLIVIVVVIVLIVKGCFGRTDALAGTWDFDGTTTYVFDGNGTGVMALPSISYDFTYTIDGNTLVIDYSNESVHDSTYEFTVDGDILTMVGGCRTDFADIQNKKECGGNRIGRAHV